MNNVTNEWAAADEAFERGQQAYLDWCRAIAKLYAEGTKTQEEIARRYDTDQQRVSKAVQIGNDKRLSLINLRQAPKSELVLYLLTTLPDKDFEELCKPTTTQKIILEHKRRLDAPAKAKKAMENEALHNEIKARLAEKEARETLGAELRAKNKAAQAERHTNFDVSFKGLLEQAQCYQPQAILDDSSPIEYLIQAFAAMLQFGGPQAAKLVKQMFSSAYHPDSGKVKPDGNLLSGINKALSYLEK